MINEGKDPMQYHRLFHNPQLCSDGEEWTAEGEQTFSLMLSRAFQDTAAAFVDCAEVLLDHSIPECVSSIDDCASCL